MAHMIATHTHTAKLADNNDPQVAPVEQESQGTIWIDFGDGGGARWAELTLDTLDEVCAVLERVKPADTIT